MATGEYEIKDLYLGAFALTRGAKLLRVDKDASGWGHLIFEADALPPIFEEWKDPTTEVNVRQFLGFVRWLRGQIRTTGRRYGGDEPATRPATS